MCVGGEEDSERGMNKTLAESDQDNDVRNTGGVTRSDWGWDVDGEVEDKLFQKLPVELRAHRRRGGQACVQSSKCGPGGGTQQQERFACHLPILHTNAVSRSPACYDLLKKLFSEVGERNNKYRMKWNFKAHRWLDPHPGMGGGGSRCRDTDPGVKIRQGLQKLLAPLSPPPPPPCRWVPLLPLIGRAVCVNERGMSKSQGCSTQQHFKSPTDRI